MYDIIIKNGIIYDGTGAAPFRADIGLSGEKIAAVGEIKERADMIIDALNLIITPGFVDIHSHSDYYLLINPNAESKVRQGVTTEICGNCGYSAAPVSGVILKERRETYKREYDLDLNLSTISDYLSELERRGHSVNFVSQIGQNTLRGSVMGMDNRAPSNDEVRQMTDLISGAMTEGAFGISLGLIYPPSCYCDKEELVAVCRAASRHNAVLSAHIRSEGDMLIEAVEEVISICEDAGISLQISHLKTSGRDNWKKIDDLFEVIERARDRGLPVECDRYPYTASNTGLLATLPIWVYDGGTGHILRRLKDPNTRLRISEELLSAYPDEDNWDRIQISNVLSDKNRLYEGKTVRQAASLAGKGCSDFVFDILMEEDTNVEIILFSMCEENLCSILKKPYVMIGSDSGARAHYGKLGAGMPHPRGFGTFPRLLKRYALEKKLFSFQTAVKKMTLDPCIKFNIKDRGMIKEEMYADIVCIDPERLNDTSSYEKPISYPKGIEFVFVNGKVTVKKGEHTGERAGMALRRNR